jgi:enoyl-CoA hydratase/carnithine racemase
VTGIPLAGGTLGLCTAQIPPRHHTEMLLHGRLVDARGAHARGVIDEVVAGADLIERATERARALFDVDLPAYAINKRLLRAPAFDGAAREADALTAGLTGSNPFAGIAR